jgi:hypothetical protein
VIPLRLQRSRKKGSRLISPNGLPIVCCTRPGKWGNPFCAGKLGPMDRRPIDTAGAIGFFSAMLHDPELAMAAGYPTTEQVHAQLAGKNLACWCSLCPRHAAGKPLNETCDECSSCHVDVLGTILFTRISKGGAR